MSVGFFTPYNVPGEMYAGRVGEFTPPTYLQNLKANIDLFNTHGASPTHYLKGLTSRFSDMTTVSAEEANNSLSQYGVKPYNHSITRGELEFRLNQARQDSDNTRLLEIYKESNQPSVAQELITNTIAGVGSLVSDPLNIALSFVGLPEAGVANVLSKFGVVAREVEVGSAIASQAGKMVKTGDIIGKLPLTEAVKVAGRNAYNPLVKWGIGAVEGSSANVLTDILFTKPASDYLHVDYSWEDVASGAVMGAVLGSGALWGIPSEVLKKAGKSIHANTPSSFLNKITKMTPDQIRRSASDGVLDLKGQQVEDVIKLREDVIKSNTLSKMEKDLSPRNNLNGGYERLSDSFRKLPYSADTKVSMVTKAISDLVSGRGIDVEYIKRLDTASKISTVFNRNITKSAIKTEQLPSGRFKAFIEGEEGALANVKIERANENDAIDDLWSIYKVNLTQSERVKGNLLKAINERMEAIEEASLHLADDDREAAIDTLINYLTKGKAKKLNREINKLELQREEKNPIFEEQESLGDEFTLLDDEVNIKRGEFEKLHSDARAEAEHIIDNFEQEYNSIKEYMEATTLGDRLQESGNISIPELERIIDNLKHPYGTTTENIPMPDNSYAAQIQKNNDNIITLEEELLKITSDLNEHGISAANLDHDRGTGEKFTEQINRCNKVIDSIPEIISSIHEVVSNVVGGVYDVVNKVGESVPMSVRIGEELKTALAKFNLNQREIDFLSNKINTLLDTSTLVDMAAKRIDDINAYRGTIISRIDKAIKNNEEVITSKTNEEVSPTGMTKINDSLSKLMAMKKSLENGSTGYQGIGLNQYIPLIADSLFEFENKIIHEKRTLLLQQSKIKERVLQIIGFTSSAMENMEKIGQVGDKAHLVMEKLRSLVGNSLTSFTGSRVSVESMQRIKAISFKRVIEDIHRLGLIDVFRREEYKKDIFDNLLKLKYGEDINNADDAARIALTLHKHFGKFVDDFNSVGGNITRLGAFLTPDIGKLKDFASYVNAQRNGDFNKMSGVEYSNLCKNMFIDWILPKLDHEVMFHEKGIINPKDKYNELSTIYDDLVYGRALNGELFTKKSPSLIDSDDILKFKDRDSELEFVLNFCEDSLEGSIKSSVDNLYNSYGLMAMFGPKPHNGIETIFQGLKQHFTDNNEGAIAEYMHGKRTALKHEIANVDGTTSTPGRGTAAMVGSLFRFFRTFDLGKVFPKSLSDLVQQTSALALTGAKGGVKGFIRNMQFNLEGITSQEAKIIAESIGVGRDAFNVSVANNYNMGEMYHSIANLPLNKHTLDTHLTTFTKSAQDIYFSKVVFLKQLTEANSKGTSLSWSNHMANMAEIQYKSLGTDFKRYLNEYKITEFEWDLVRDYAVKTEHEILSTYGHNTTDYKNNRKFLVTDNIADIPYEEIYNRYNDKFKENNGGKDLTPDRLYSFLREIQNKFDIMATDVVYNALTIPEARTMKFLNQGTSPGTFVGEAARFMTQFKAFPAAQFRQNYGRVLGRNADFGQISIWKNLMKGDTLKDVGGYAAGIIAMNFATQWAIDILSGKSPTDFTEKGNWVSPVADCGALSPAGMLLLNSFKGDDSGRNWYKNLLFNIAGPATTRTADSVSRVLIQPLNREGTLTEKLQDIGTQFGHESINNVPWHNAILFEIAWNSLLGNHLHELLEPGYTYEKAENLEERTGQTSDAAQFDIWNPEIY